jgi:uncharacterized cupin superfamily protein
VNRAFWAASYAADGRWDPFGPPDAPVGRVRWLSHEDGERLCGVWEIEPDELPPRTRVPMHLREIVYIIDGEVEVDIEGGPTLRLREGDQACFEPGTVSYWTVLASLREHFIYVPGSAGSAGPS